MTGVAFLALVAAQALGTVPPAPSGGELPFGAVEVVDPVAPALRRYMQCVRESVDRRGGIRSDDRALHRRNVDAAILDCADVRASAVAEAEGALARAPDYADPARRDRAIRHAFEGSEQQQRAMPEIMAQVRRERGQDVRGGTVNIPPEIAAQVIPYLQCTMQRTNARLPAADQEAMRELRAAAIADCADTRGRGFEEADRILRRHRAMRNEAARHDFINAAFDSVDRSYEPLIERLAPRQAPASETGN
ncbi:MAG TPA: hypothetical protein VEW04_08205 [Allosphingosinicella sp.]|nr:hypothetical protein [Allosphingosinicella sp.]